jgi:hypothetical protein
MVSSADGGSWETTALAMHPAAPRRRRRTSAIAPRTTPISTSVRRHV